MPTEGAAAATGRNYRELLKAEDLEWIGGHPDAQTISLVLTRATNHPLKHRRRNLGNDPPMYSSVFALLQFDVVPAAPQKTKLAYRSPSHQDAYLLFRTLCRLSTKSHTDPETGIVNPYTLQSKLLSLGLLRSILDLSGSFFRQVDIFLDAVRKFLCPALLENCVSHEKEVLQLSLGLFSQMVTLFKEHLQVEIEVFLTEVFFNLLNSEARSEEHKLLVLKVLHAICSDADAVAEIFLNYDLKFDKFGFPCVTGLFERLVSTLSNLTVQIGSKLRQRNKAEKLLATTALTSLVAISDALEECASLHKPGTPAETDEDGNEQRSAAELNAMSTTARFRARERILSVSQEGFKKFDAKARVGVQYLVDQGLIEATPASTAKFLCSYSDEVNKKVLGDYMGDLRYQPVLEEYTQLIDFEDITIDEGIRHYLLGFRIPGESQCINRYMESFAKRFVSLNPDHFETEDAAYVLAYSIIMLQTDLHNPNIKEEKKISVLGFQNMCRGINNKKNFPPEYLAGIHARIKADPFTLREDDVARKEKNAARLSTKPKNMSAADLQALITAQGEEWMNRYNGRFACIAQRFCSATDQIVYHRSKSGVHTHAMPMFSIAHKYLLDALSAMLENVSSKKVVAMCLRGLANGVRVAGVYRLDKPLTKYIKTLCKFCNLADPFRKKQKKHLVTASKLLELGKKDGNILRHTWESVLTVISQLGRLREFMEMGPQQPQFNRKASKRELRKMEEEAARQAVMHTVATTVSTEVKEGQVDHIFLVSPGLDAESIVCFINALTNVSQRELEGKAPRRFSLQKVVEVADYNLSVRDMAVWTEIWKILTPYFDFVGCHKDMQVALYAVDSLKQLSMKFMDMGEVPGSRFQTYFMKPFETIVRKSKDMVIREYILSVMQNIVLAKVKSIRSGWKNVLSALAIVSNDKKPNDNLVNLGHSVVALIMQKHFNPAKLHFVDLVSCLLSYAKCHLVAECLQAMDFLKECAAYLARGEVPIASVLAQVPVKEDDKPSDGKVSYTDSESHLHVWWPLLMGVANLIGDSRLTIRTAAVNTLFGSLKLAGSGFDRNLWELVFKGVLFPVFDDIRVDDASASESEKSWLKNTALVALRALIEMFSFFYDALLFLLPDILALICRCVVQDERKLACVGVTCFTQLINLCSGRFSTETWDIVCASLLHIFDMSMPYVLLRKDSHLLAEASARVAERRHSKSRQQKAHVDTKFGAGTLLSTRDDDIKVVELPWATIYTADAVSKGKERNANSESLAKSLWISAAAASAAREEGSDTLSNMNVVTQCVVQLELLGSIDSFIFELLKHLQAQHVQMIFDCIQRSYKVAAEFDGDIEHRKSIAKRGSKTLNLSRQETVASSLLVRAIMFLYEERPDLDAISRERFKQIGEQAIQQYCALDTYVTKQGSSTMPETSAEGRLMARLTPVVILIVTGLLQMAPNQFRSHIQWLYGPLIALMRCNNRDVRTVLGDVFIRQVSGLLDEKVDLPAPQSTVDPGILRQRSFNVQIPAPRSPKQRDQPPALPVRDDVVDEPVVNEEVNSGAEGDASTESAPVRDDIDSGADARDSADAINAEDESNVPEEVTATEQEDTGTDAGVEEDTSPSPEDATHDAEPDAEDASGSSGPAEDDGGEPAAAAAEGEAESQKAEAEGDDGETEEAKVVEAETEGDKEEVQAVEGEADVDESQPDTGDSQTDTGDTPVVEEVCSAPGSEFRFFVKQVVQGRRESLLRSQLHKLLLFHFARSGTNNRGGCDRPNCCRCRRCCAKQNSSCQGGGHLVCL